MCVTDVAPVLSSMTSSWRLLAVPVGRCPCVLTSCHVTALPRTRSTPHEHAARPRRRLVLRDEADPRRGGPRPHDRRPGHPRLPDHLVRVPGHPACRRPVRAGGARQHLHPDPQPHHRCVRAADRRAGGRRRGGRAGLGAGGGDPGDPEPGGRRRPRRGRCRAVRRHVQPLPAHAGPAGHRGLLRGRSGRRPGLAGGDPAEHQGPVRRGAGQPARQRPRRAGGGGRGARGRGAADRGQHGGHAVPAAADRARRGRRGALGDQVPRRARHRDRGRGGGRRHLRLRRAPGPVPGVQRAGRELPRPALLAGARAGRVRGEAAGAAAARPRPGARPALGVPAAPGGGDAEPAPGAAHRQRAGDRRVAGAARRGGDRPLRGPGVQPVVRGGAAVPAARGGRHRLLRAARRRRGGQAVRGRGGAVQPPRQHRRRTQSDHPSGVHHAQPAHRGGRGGLRHHAGPGAAVRRHREPGRPQGGSGGRLPRGQGRVGEHGHGHRTAAGHRGLAGGGPAGPAPVAPGRTAAAAGGGR
ncbi:O-acetylhomoserine sulfhydrylase / O-succinylhomoserine sulfhydrylase [Streptomyces misionensis JCM 4497]